MTALCALWDRKEVQVCFAGGQADGSAVAN